MYCTGCGSVMELIEVGKTFESYQCMECGEYEYCPCQKNINSKLNIKVGKLK